MHHKNGPEYRPKKRGDPMLPVYIGKSEYCYSNFAAMLLASAGYFVSPTTIEVLRLY